MRDDELQRVAMYGWQDRGAGSNGPVHVIGSAFADGLGQPGSLGAVWTVLKGTGNCAIVRLSDGRRIAQRGYGGPWERVGAL